MSEKDVQKNGRLRLTGRTQSFMVKQKEGLGVCALLSVLALAACAGAPGTVSPAPDAVTSATKVQEADVHSGATEQAGTDASSGATQQTAPETGTLP